eukprot:scaffold1922_cov101-Isochrysis_galbana.AAC.4
MAATNADMSHTTTRPSESPVARESLLSETPSAVSDSVGAHAPRTAKACPVPPPMARMFHTRRCPSAPPDTSVGAAASACALGSRKAMHSTDLSTPPVQTLPPCPARGWTAESGPPPLLQLSTHLALAGSSSSGRVSVALTPPDTIDQIVISPSMAPVASSSAGAQ